jgi:hypothetical protein
MFRQDFQQHTFRHNWLFRLSGRLIKYFCLLVLGYGLVFIVSIGLGLLSMISVTIPFVWQVIRVVGIFLLGLGAIATIVEGLR